MVRHIIIILLWWRCYIKRTITRVVFRIRLALRILRGRELHNEYRKIQNYYNAIAIIKKTIWKHQKQAQRSATAGGGRREKWKPALVGEFNDCLSAAARLDRTVRVYSRDDPLTAAVMVFNVLYFIAVFELVLYSYMVVNRDWLFSTYTRTLSDEAYPAAGGSGDGDSDLEYDYGSFVVDYWHQ